MDVAGRTRGLLAVLGAVALLAAAGTTSASANVSPAWLHTTFGDISTADGVRYGARDNLNAPLDGLKILQVGDRYVGVYHAPGGKSFETHVATSTDLLHWTRQATLDTDASQATIAAVGKGFLVAYEKVFTADVLPFTPLPRELDVVNGLAGRVRIRFRHYPNLDRLLTGDAGRQFTAPRTAAMTAEGTPEIESVQLTKGLRHSRIEVGLHHFADTNGDGFPDADRQGTGVLTDFRHWKDADAPALNQAFLSLTELHPGYDSAPAGNIGDRDSLVTGTGRLVLHEGQYRAGRFDTWRLFLRDTAAGTLRPLTVRTAGRSQAFGNPTVSRVVGPDGGPSLFFSVFVFSEGAAPGEAGSLLFHRSLSG